MFIMSKQAWLVAVVHVVFIVVLVIIGIYYNAVARNMIYATVFGLLYVLLLTYDTACLTNGDCGIWSWIRSILWIIFPIVTMIFLLTSMDTSVKSVANQINASA